MARWALIAIAFFALACGAAEAQSSRTQVYVPLVAREQPPTPTPTPTPIPTPTPRPFVLYVESHATTRSLSYQYVYFKLVNGTGGTVYFPRATATFYGPDGRIMGSDYGFTTFTMLRPGESSTGLLLAQPQEGWVRYELATSFQGSSFIQYVHDGLSVTDWNNYRAGNWVYVVGRVTNNSGQTVRFLQLDVGLFDSGGGILAAESTHPFGTADAPAGASTSFSVQHYDPNRRIPDGYSYTVQAEGRR